MKTVGTRSTHAIRKNGTATPAPALTTMLGRSRRTTFAASTKLRTRFRRLRVVGTLRTDRLAVDRLVQDPMHDRRSLHRPHETGAVVLTHPVGAPSRKPGESHRPGPGRRQPSGEVFRGQGQPLDTE